MNTEEVALGCYGLENEGWFDPWSLLNSLKKRSIQLGAEYVEGDVEGFEFKDQPDMHMTGVEGVYKGLDSLNVNFKYYFCYAAYLDVRKKNLQVKLPSGETRSIKFGIAVIATGPNSGKVARMARVGMGEGLLSVPLPVEPR